MISTSTQSLKAADLLVVVHGGAVTTHVQTDETNALPLLTATLQADSFGLRPLVVVALGASALGSPTYTDLFVGLHAPL